VRGRIPRGHASSTHPHRWPRSRCATPRALPLGVCVGQLDEVIGLARSAFRRGDDVTSDPSRTRERASAGCGMRPLFTTKGPRG
jgi:hypothetical protein